VLRDTVISEGIQKLAETLGIAGSGTIATGLAACATRVTDVILWARSGSSAERASAAIEHAASRIEGADVTRAKVVTELEQLSSASYLVEAIVEDHASKCKMLSGLAELSSQQDTDAILATTTSSLSIAELATSSGRPERFVGLHVFNPVPRMPLVELVYAPQTSDETKQRTRALCDQLGKTAVEVPDTPGFVVNRLLFPYLYSAVELMTEAGLSPEDVDNCMTLGAGLPMGPLALLDFVGLDVSKAIGDSIGLKAPQALEDLVAEGALGRKAARGFYNYP
jgi:3-hydroxybutyryl-CoA dehydrogenase